MVRPGPPHRAALRTGSETAREGGGALAGSGSGHRRAAPAPQARAARQSTAHRQQIRWGLSAGREADHSVPRGPSRPRKEVTSALRTPARRLGWGGGWLRVTSAPGGCGSASELPTMVWRPRRKRGPWAAGLGGVGRRPSAPPGPGGRTQTLGPGPGSRCGLPSTRPTRCAGGRSEPPASGVPPAAASLGPRGGAPGGVPFGG